MGVKSYFIFFVTLFLLACQLVAIEKSLDRYLVADNKDFSVYYQVTTKKLWADDKTSVVYAEPQVITLNACKGETEVFILFFELKKSLEQINITVSDLKNSVNQSIIKKDIFTVHLLGKVAALDARGKKRLAFDKIYNVNEYDLKNGKRSAFMIKFRIPYEVETGYYRATIFIAAAEKQLTQIPIKIKVYDFSLSKKVNLRFSAGFPKYKTSTNPLKRKPDDQTLPVDMAKVRSIWIKQLNNDRLSTQNTSIPTPGLTKENGKYILDFTQFDKRIDELIKQKVLFRARTPFLYFLGGHYWYPLERYFGDITSPAGDKTKRPGSTYLENTNLRPEFLTGYLDVAKQVNEHINKKGYRPHFFDVLCDEPAIQLKGLVGRLGKALVETVPDIQLSMLGMPSSASEFKEYRGIQTHLFISDAAFEMVFPKGFVDKKSNEIFEVYSLYSALQLDKEPLFARLMFWWAWKIRADSMWYWVIAEWSRPTPLTCYGGNGGFYVVYPDEKNVNSAFLTGIRYEQFREGLEDYEYLLELSKRSEAVRKKLNGARENFPDRRRSDELVGQLIISRGFLDGWVSDSNKYITVKQQLFDEITAINQEPLVLITSDLFDGAKTEANKVTLKGLADSKAVISINGKLVENTNGHFEFSQNLKNGANIVTILVKQGSKQKQLIRVYHRQKQQRFKTIINDDFTFKNGSYNGLDNWQCYDWGRGLGLGQFKPAEITTNGQVKATGDPSLKSGHIRPAATHSGLSRQCELTPPADGRISFNFYTLNDIQFKLKIEVFGKLNGKKVKMQKWFPSEETGMFNRYTVKFDQLSKYQPGVVVNGMAIFVIETKETRQDWRYWIDDFKVEYPL
ncbi:MAG: DUF4091 domain-containing protein [Victivallaceae bacterium]|nr:DUF4091 domain-containing protein [Victivallaceae bacterium]